MRDMKPNVKDYKEIRGTLVKKKRTIFGGHYLFINDRSHTVSMKSGKSAFDLYSVGMQLTVGYIGHTLINIRSGIVENEDWFDRFRFGEQIEKQSICLDGDIH